jgi:hypothetical protein
MPLLELWESSPAAIDQFTIEQIVAAAGDGVLTDASKCSQELRSYLARVPHSKLAEYVERCLSSSFNRSGFVLQDLVNELGRRLDYKVTNGRYQGTQNSIGFDGIWISPEGHTIIIEVKTTDAYRISLDTIIRYREKLLATSQIHHPCSILIVVGRQETGELEAQVRGSRHAWDIRLISADSLLKLAQLKLESDSPETGKKIRMLLTPREYTRLDDMIDVMFTAAKDVESAASTELRNDEDDQPSGGPAAKRWVFTETRLLDEKRQTIIAALSRRESTPFVQKTRALYWNPEHDVRAACTISKRYQRSSIYRYWYAYHPQWDEFLSEGRRSFLVLGAMDLDKAFAIPADVVRSLLEGLQTTDKDGVPRYWHMHLSETPNGEIALNLPKRKRVLSLQPYELQVTADRSRN